MERIPVQSSNISTIGYDAATETLEIEFLGSGVYEYRNVPQAVHEGLMGAVSHGGYFNREIKDAYPFSKIG